jgi:hypothetical protein
MIRLTIGPVIGLSVEFFGNATISNEKRGRCRARPGRSVGLVRLHHSVPLLLRHSRPPPCHGRPPARRVADCLDEGSLVRSVECGCLQANRVTVTKFCHCDNSARDDLARRFGLTLVA